MKHIFGFRGLGGARIPDSVYDAWHESTDRERQLALTAPMMALEADLAIALAGRPRICGEKPDAETLTGQLAELYRREGARFLQRLRGPFAIAVIERKTDRSLLAIDRMGAERLTWGTAADRLVFANAATLVAEALEQPITLKNQSLFDFMLGHVVAAPDTAFQGVEELLPGHYVEFSGSEPKRCRYWEPSYERVPAKQLLELQQAVLPTLERGIVASGIDGKSGSFLSGGLDSSTVTGLLAKCQPETTKAFSVGFGVDEFDELAFARIASKHFKCDHYEYEVTPADIVDIIPRIAANYDEPFGNSSAVPTYCCARLARQHGVEHLLAGDGGDEIFAGNERYLKQGVFELYQRIPHWLRQSVFEPLAAVIDPDNPIVPLRKFSSYVQQAQVPLPERFETWNLIYREGASRVFNPDFLKSIDTAYPLRKMRNAWESCPSDDLLDQMLWYDWKYTLADNDLPKVSRMTELAGVRVSYPMLDDELVDLSLKIPSDSKLSKTELRTFFRNSIRDFLPGEILTKSKHGFGLPFGVWLKTDSALQEIVYDSLDALKHRDIFDNEFIDRVSNEHKDGHASYYGYAIWDLVILEQWLHHHLYSRTPTQHRSPTDGEAAEIN